MKLTINGIGGVLVEYTPDIDDVVTRKMRHNATVIEFSERDFQKLCAAFMEAMVMRFDKKGGGGAMRTKKDYRSPMVNCKESQWHCYARSPSTERNCVHYQALPHGVKAPNGKRYCANKTTRGYCLVDKPITGGE
jgi:hypothetical protein